MSITKITTPELLDFPKDSTSSANTSGTVIPTGPTGISVDYLVVAGGGAGASGYGGIGGGGGGAGGLRTSYPGGSGGGSPSESTLYLSTSTSYTIDVGVGGSGSTHTTGDSGTDGGDSTFASITSEKGGNAKSYINGAAAGQSQTGGSGGGGVGWSSITPGLGTTNQGFDGGAGQTNSLSPYRGGGGGGAGSSGSNSLSSGGGGAGLQVNIDGLNNFYAGGGGGGAYTGAGTGGSSVGGNGGADNSGSGCADGSAASPANRGSGGGGGVRSGGPNCGLGGNGSDGIIILRVASTTTATFSAGVTSTLTQVGGGAWSSGDKIYTITATSGSETVSFTTTGTGIRPTTNLNAGEFRFNTTTGYVEYYDGSSWSQIADEYISGQPSACICNYPITGAALYQFEDNANDTCGGYNGAASNMTWGTGKFGNCGIFNGSSSYITLPNSVEVYKETGKFAISAWFKTDTIPGTEQMLYCTFETAYLFIKLKASGVIEGQVAEASTGTGRICETPTGTISTGVWYHVVFTGDTNDLRLYINGTLSDSESTWNGTFYTSSAGCSIGSRNTGTNQFWDGEIDQLRIFPSALTSTQVSELYNEVVCN